ncbi:MAG: PQQ-binding-like beta-propeller repeat protein [Planctomycetes bacterium]|nr:PQQ-binding-like beta-propeller repeat protein [Planctomycetota bacterium]
MISLWPVRTGVLVDQGVAYFGAGIFPTEGVFLYAVDAASGKLLWKNDQASELRMAQMSPQGYMLCTPQQLIVPMSRLAPGVFDRKTGQSEKRLSIYYGGGTFAALNGQCLYTGCEGAQCFPLDADGARTHGTSPSVANFPGGQLVFAGGRLYSCATPKGPGVSKAIAAFEWNQPDKMPTEEEIRRGQAKPPTPPKELWQCAFETPECIIMAGDLLYVGGPGRVGAITPADGKLVWSHEVDGVALSLAASGGRLFVSTDKGNIECFVPQGSSPVAQTAAPAPNVEVAAQWKQAADAILKQAPQNHKGFALIYGVETGELAIELAKRTDLLIHAVSPDAAKVEAARRRIEAAGLYGGRIVVEQWPLEKVPYTQYFADLVVSETAIATGKPPGTAAEAFRMAKPWHGSVVMGTVKTDVDAAPLKQWIEKSPLAAAKIVSEAGTWAVLKRPGLPGAKPWTHQYAVPGATGSSQDDLVRAPLRVQWFGDPGPSEYVDRHYWGAAPLAYEGRMFCCTYNDVSAYDVYTGAKHWTYPLKDAVRAHLADVPSNVAIGPEGYFVAVEDICYRLDPATGKLLGQFKVPDAAPGQRRMWGYVALVDGVLVGSRTLGYLPMQKWRKSRGEQISWWLLSDQLFAMDAQTGKVLWQYQTEWFRHNSVVTSPSKDAQAGAVFVSHPGGTPQQQQEAIIETKPSIDAYPEKEKARVQKIMAKPYVELLSALDLKTGKPRWQKTVDWTVCGGDRGTLIFQDDVRPAHWRSENDEASHDRPGCAADVHASGEALRTVQCLGPHALLPQRGVWLFR